MTLLVQVDEKLWDGTSGNALARDHLLVISLGGEVKVAVVGWQGYEVVLLSAVVSHDVVVVVLVSFRGPVVIDLEVGQAVVSCSVVCNLKKFVFVHEEDSICV